MVKSVTVRGERELDKIVCAGPPALSFVTTPTQRVQNTARLSRLEVSFPDLHVHENRIEDQIVDHSIARHGRDPIREL